MNHHASMNRIHRLIWNEVRSAWVPVAETARGRGKSGRAGSGRVRSIASRNLVAAAISVALAPLAHATPPLAELLARCIRSDEFDSCGGRGIGGADGREK